MNLKYILDNVYLDDLRRSGIYMIINISNNKIYIGSAKRFVHRKRNHFNDLIKNKHHSDKLQKSYNKYGKDNFIFKMIEYVNDVNELIKREQYYIDILKPEYNIAKTAGSSLGCKRSEKTKQILRELNELGIIGRRGMKNSAEHNRKTSEGRIGMKFSDETRKKQSIKRLGVPAWNKGTKGMGLTTAWNKGKKLSKEHGINCTKKAHEANKKKVYAYDIIDNNLKIFNSIGDCKLFFDVVSIQYYLGKKKVFKSKFFLSYNKINKMSLV